MKNIFYKIGKERLSLIILESVSVLDVFRKIGLSRSGDQYIKFYQFVDDAGISIAHFKKVPRLQKTDYVPVAKFLHSNSRIDSSKLKEKLIKEGYFNYQCSICNNTGEWMGQKITLELDHINGINDDNRLENLRILCPNCHSQTHTFRRLKAMKKYFCPSCSNLYRGYGENCPECSREKQVTKIIWPDKEYLTKLVWTYPLIQVGKKLGVSDKAVKKRCLKEKIELPERGFWLRKRRIASW